jgi:hypothetical protein
VCVCVHYTSNYNRLHTYRYYYKPLDLEYK